MTDPKPPPPGIPTGYMVPNGPAPKMPEPRKDEQPWVGKRKGKARKRR